MDFYDDAATFVKKFEGFTPNATWDVNAYRLGHGSDTVTSPDGTYRKVVKGDTTTKEMAGKDLARRIKEGFEPKVKKQIGEPYYSNLPDPAKISLISFAYNYGSITKPAIIEAARTGDVTKLADAIVESTKNDNSGKSFYEALRKRRQKEADYAKSVIKKTTELLKKNPIPTAIVTLLLIVSGYVLYTQLTKKSKK